MGDRSSRRASSQHAFIERSYHGWPEAPAWSSMTISERGEESIERCAEQ
jgi:hypothetical protein